MTTAFAAATATLAALLPSVGRLPSQQTPAAPTTQPSAPTPPTPLPKRTPDTRPTGVTPGDVRATTGFRAAPPGQPQPGDPPAVRTLDEALRVAFERSPTVLLATERAVRTRETVNQITGVRGPQIGASLGYTRLSGGNAFGAGGGFGGAGAGTSPFPTGLQVPPPGSVPITLSGGGGFSSGGSAGGVAPGTAGQLGGGAGAASAAGGAGVTRAATRDAGRQTGGGGQQPGNGNGDGSGNEFGGGSLNQLNARVTISQGIDITGLIRTVDQLGDLELALSRLELARVRQELALNVRNGFYNVLRTQAFVRVNEASVAQSEEQLRVTRAQRAAGVASDFDVLRAQTQLDNNRQALITARNQVAIAKNGFANLLGLDPSTPVDLRSPNAVPPLPVLDETPLLERALAQRPEYLQADVNILKAQKNVRYARRGLEPSLSANLTGSFNANEGVRASERAAAALGVTLTLPLSDAGITRAAVAGARADERQALIQKDQFVRGIKAEVQQSIIAVRDANERAQVAGQTVTQAREALRLAGVRFRAGVGTQLEINDAQTALTQAETNAVNAQYDYLTALARLSRSVGNPE